MTSDRNRTAPPVAPPVSLDLALEQSHDVQAKVEACADDLSSANDIVKKKIAEGATTLPAQRALADSEMVESRVQECADDLQNVNEALAQGIDDLKQSAIALTRSRKALADTEAALAIAQVEEKKARLRALHDSTTGLPNRDQFDERLGHAIALAQRHQWTLAVMFLDLDGFKSVNDTEGHAAGDAVLKEVAKRLLKHARVEDTVCRNGGDEFLYLLINPQGRDNVARIATAVLNTIAEPIDMGAVQLIITSSIGIAVYPDDGTTGDQLIKNADAAMYVAKKRTRCWYFFNALGSRNSPA